MERFLPSQKQDIGTFAMCHPHKMPVSKKRGLYFLNCAIFYMSGQLLCNTDWKKEGLPSTTALSLQKVPLLSMRAEDPGFGLNGRLWGPFAVASGHFFQCVVIAKADTALAGVLAGTENYSQVGFLSNQSNAALPFEDS